MRLFPDDAPMAELADLFFVELPQRMRSMRVALREGDESGLRFLAHQLRGAAGGYGFPEVGEHAGAIEDHLAAGAASPGDIEGRLDRIDALLDRLAAAV
jgi:HPt (histidine-containing phosphotransfer) domain-containing protein